ncbi:hypothetical protein ACVWWR_005575 [Bradyrhizobium sp. LM3.2]
MTWKVRPTPASQIVCGRWPDMVAAVDQNLALVRLQEAVEEIEQRGLAGTVGADDAEDLVLVQLEADILHGLEATERAREVANLKHDLAGRGALLRAGLQCRHVGGGRSRSVVDRCFGRIPFAQEIAQFPKEAFRCQQDHADNGKAEDDALDAGDARTGLRVQDFGERDQNDRPDDRTPDRADAAEHHEPVSACADTSMPNTEAGVTTSRTCA